MMTIKKLTKDADGSWNWHVVPDEDEYIALGDEDMADRYFFTDRYGEGIFCEYPNGNVKQLTGTMQFSACETVSGMRRKLIKWFND